MFKKLLLLFTFLFSVPALAGGWTAFNGPDAGQMQLRYESNGYTIGIGCKTTVPICGFYVVDPKCKDVMNPMPSMINSEKKAGLFQAVCGKMRLPEVPLHYVRIFGPPQTIMQLFQQKQNFRVVWADPQSDEIHEVYFPIDELDMQDVQRQLENKPKGNPSYLKEDKNV